MRDRSSYTMQNLLLIHLTLWIFSEVKYIKVCHNLGFLQCFSPILTWYVWDISTRDLEGWKTHLNSVKNYSQNNFTHTPKHHNLKPKSLKLLCSTVFFLVTKFECSFHVHCCHCGFLLQSKDVLVVRLDVSSKGVEVNGCLSLCVSHAADWWLGVSCLSPYDCWNRLEPLHNYWTAWEDGNHSFNKLHDSFFLFFSNIVIF